MSSNVFQDDMTFETTTEGTDADSMHSGGAVSKAGYYHVVVDGIEKVEKEGKLPHLLVSMTILAGTEDSQIDKRLYHRIFLAKWQERPDDVNLTPGIMAPYDPADEKDRKRLDGINAFAYAFGLLTDEDLGREKVKIPFHMIEGRQAVVKVQQDSDWTDSKGNKRAGGFKILWNNDAWPIGHSEVSDVPKDPEALAMIGGTDPGTAAGGAADYSDI